MTRELKIGLGLALLCLSIQVPAKALSLTSDAASKEYQGAVEAVSKQVSPFRPFQKAYDKIRRSKKYKSLKAKEENKEVSATFKLPGGLLKVVRGYEWHSDTFIKPGMARDEAFQIAAILFGPIRGGPVSRIKGNLIQIGSHDMPPTDEPGCYSSVTLKVRGEGIDEVKSAGGC